jgi:hypothetical protein
VGDSRAEANECRIKGQLYGNHCFGTYTSEATIAYDGHNWMAITDRRSQPNPKRPPSL